MEKRRPRLLRTYLGPRSRGGLRRQPGPSEPWISPQVDPRRLFSTSSSDSPGGSSDSLSASPSLSEDPDFLPPKNLQLSPRRQHQARPRRGAEEAHQGGEAEGPSQEEDEGGRAPHQEQWGQEDRAPQERAPQRGGEKYSVPRQGGQTTRGSTTSSSSLVPPTPLHRNITLRPRQQGPLRNNSTLWGRIRASFSPHKKKKILSEADCSFQSPPPQAPETPLTQEPGSSISPASSMLLLSAVKSETIQTDKEKVYGECQQVGPLSFEECIPPEKMHKCEKTGEGVFGEVFRTEGQRGTVALKVIPIEGSDRVNGEPQKTFSEILPEIIISKELSLLAEEKDNQTSGFISLHSIHCVRGAYPKCLLKAWDGYNRLRSSENDRPDFFGNQQLFIILEFEFGGTDLENMCEKQLNSVVVAKSILHQVTASLAVAEEALRFEHRDLHWGNVLVKKTHLKELGFTLNGETHRVSTQGILVSIIDYTLSRLEKDGLTVYCDLSTDEELFQGRGDYQFDIYRQMRTENANSWADYSPHSNILWLHYLTDKLLKSVTYQKKPATSSMKMLQKQLQLFSKEVLGFSSARDLLSRSTFFH